MAPMDFRHDATGRYAGTATTVSGKTVAHSNRSVLSLAMKWSLAIALLVAFGMGALGWYLINQQERAFDRQTSQLGDLLAEQLARSAAEPLLAEDAFALELLVRRQLDDQLVIGAAVFDRDGRLRIEAGRLPAFTAQAEVEPASIDDRGESVPTNPGAPRNVDVPPLDASLHTRPVRFQDLVAGRVVLGLNRAPLEQDRRSLIGVMLWTTLGLILLIVGLAFPLARWMSAPIRRLARGEQEPTLPQSPVLLVEDRRQDELGEIARRIQRLSTDAAGKRQVETMLHRYLSPGVVRSVLSRPNGMDLGGRALHGSVLFCDIVDFTRLSRGLTPTQVGALVNDYFGAFARAGAWCGGTVDKFIGDCVMILFGVPEPERRHALSAVVCASAIVRLAEAINLRRRALGQPTVRFRVAINSGEMLAGNLGSLERMEFTVVGSSVNLASRLCERTPEDGLAITPDTLAEPGVSECARVEVMPALRLKGYDRPVAPYLINGLNPAGEARVRACLEAVTEQTLETV
jgi:adenylate cyclase